MDPWALVASWVWMVPAAGATAAMVTWRARRRGQTGGRRLAYDAARLDLRRAEQIARQRSMAARVARADLARVTAERRAQRASLEQVAQARQVVREHDRDAKAAAAEVRARRVRLLAARAEIPAASDPSPLERLHASHDTVTARWMQYETDPARAIAYPAMSDGRSPASAEYFRAAAKAVELRRTLEGKKTPAAYAEYRDAVTDLERAFDAAEVAAKIQAGERPPATAWQETLTRAVDDVAIAVERWSWLRRRRDRD